MVYSDASLEPSDGGSRLRMCWLVVEVNGPLRFGEVCDVPSEVIASMEDRQQYIAHGEIMAPMLLYFLHGHHFSHSIILHFVDNMAALSCQVMGSSRIADLSAAAHITALCTARVQASIWWEHVESAANLADGGSRAGIADDAAKREGIPLRHRDWPHENGRYLLLNELRVKIIGQLKGTLHKYPLFLSLNIYKGQEDHWGGKGHSPLYRGIPLLFTLPRRRLAKH